MQLQELFERLPYTGALPKGEVTGIAADSRKVKPGDVFVCTVGRAMDSHRYAAKALESGAVLVVSEHSLGLSKEVSVQNGREAYALLCAAFYGNAASRLTLIAVTGTNGKTTVTSVVKQLLEKAGYKVGLIGTIYSQIDQMEIPAKYTTPEAGDLHALLARMESAGCTHVVMEASSQALDQKRLYGLRFAAAVFTNLTQDHLDYHGTMENYYEAKKTLFSQCEVAVVNVDDPYGKRLAGEVKCPCITFSDHDNTADYTARNLELRASGVQFELVGNSFIHRVHFPMPGDYSCHNALAAALAAIVVGVPAQDACEGLGACRGVRGRCEVLYSGEYTIICDFAHTGDGIENVLSGIRPFVEKRLVVLFGCAGDRDAKKRPAMGEAACRYGDFIVLSSDNPRSEDPYHILADVEPIIQKSGKPYLVEVDRRRAVQRALEQLKAGDVLVMCGKGHEDYQVLNGVTVYLDEHRIVADWLKNRME